MLFLEDRTLESQWRALCDKWIPAKQLGCFTYSLRAWDLRAKVSNLVHRNEDYGDTQHKIDGETVAK
jgi:hypothetical protein